ncbi:MAG: hypothetical protein QM778_15120 [Myxococcales bacterium]
MPFVRRSVLGLAFAALTACGSPPATTTGGGNGSLDGPGDGDGDDAPGDGDGDGNGKPQAPVSLKSCGSDNPAGLSDKDVKTLLAGGEPGDMRFVYPYDGTVFPRGLAAPILMWDGAGDGANAVYVHMKSSAFEFEGCLKPSAKGQIALPQNVWEQAAAGTGGKSDPFQLELSVLSGGKAKGPIKRAIVIAPGSLKGSVFYNSYSSSIARKAGATGGAVLRIPPGGSAEMFVGKNGCAGCHGASADGKRLVTSEGVYKLTPDIGVNPPRERQTTTEFAGLTPDGSVYAYQGKVFETDSGSQLMNTGLPTSAMEIAWSPDGRWVSFIDGPVDPRGGPVAAIPLPCVLPNVPPGCGTAMAPGPSSGGNNGLLTIMSWDKTARTMGDKRRITNLSDQAQWPLFLPDNKGLIYTDTATNDLLILDVASGTSTVLAKAMGFKSVQDVKDNKTFLPYAADGEARQAYFPTVAPVAAGGYFWVYFDTPRRYGNMNTSKIRLRPHGPERHRERDLAQPEHPGGRQLHRLQAAVGHSHRDLPRRHLQGRPERAALLSPGPGDGRQQSPRLLGSRPLPRRGRDLRQWHQVLLGFLQRRSVCAPAQPLRRDRRSLLVQFRLLRLGRPVHRRLLQHRAALSRGLGAPQGRAERLTGAPVFCSPLGPPGTIGGPLEWASKAGMSRARSDDPDSRPVQRGVCRGLRHHPGAAREDPGEPGRAHPG